MVQGPPRLPKGQLRTLVRTKARWQVKCFEKIRVDRQIRLDGELNADATDGDLTGRALDLKRFNDEDRNAGTARQAIAASGAVGGNDDGGASFANGHGAIPALGDLRNAGGAIPAVEGLALRYLDGNLFALGAIPSPSTAAAWEQALFADQDGADWAFGWSPAP